METMKEIGYAKINLHLDVTERLENGYHTVHNVMQSISLCDRITLTPLGEDAVYINCDRAGIPTDGSNLAVRAADLYRKECGISWGVALKLEKRIPMAAGLAGGSTDAAAVLRGMNRLNQNRLSREELCALGAKLGMDIPFCIVGGSAYADGKGEVLHPFVPMPHCYIVVACGGEGVSTPWAYGLLDRLYENFSDPSRHRPYGTDRLRTAIESGELSELARAMYNIFEAPILAERPVTAILRRSLLADGAEGAMMSGSGPAVFGIFAEREMAERAASHIEGLGCVAAVCEPVCSSFEF